MDPIDELQYELLRLEKWVPYYTRYLNNFKHKNKFFEAFIRHKVGKIESMCCDLLINSSGRCNWEVIAELQRRGFYVGPGERDSFGWLTGILVTSKGDIVYG
jgi:hypothetical protein